VLFLGPFLGISGAALGCHSSAKQTARSSGTEAMVQRLQALAQRSDRDKDPMVSSLRVAAMRAQPAPTEPAARIRHEIGFATELLRAGETSEAIAIFDRLNREVSGYYGPGVEEVQRTLLDRLALSHFTAALRDWCLNGTPGERCISPAPARGAGGPEERQRHARAAVEGYQRLLQSTPSDLGARWILNLSYMLLGQYPQHVPSQWLIPPKALATEHELPWFPEVANALGLDVVGHAGGSIMDDFNGDGYLDLMVSSMGLDDQLRLFLSNGDGTFTERTNEAGLKGMVGGLNLVQTDYDNDGRIDVLVLRGGWDRLGGQPLSLLHNLGGAKFEDVTEAAGLLANRSTQTAAWGDYNNDGWLDLYIGIESSDRPVPNQLFENKHDGTFRDVSQQTGTGVVGFTKGVAWGDIDNDGRLDLYVSRMDGPNVLLKNSGPDSLGTWHFADLTAKAGVAEPIESFSTWFWDYDNDGWLDIMVLGYRYLQPRNTASDVAAEYLGQPFEAETPRLYRNNGNGTFTDVTKKMRVDRVVYAMGASFGDLDNDGFLDFYAATGDPDFRSIIPNRMFRNDGGKAFQEVTAASGFGLLTKGHGVAFGDLDGDGDQDIYVNMGGMFQADLGRSVLFENPGFGNHWLTLRLEGVKSNRPAIGARIRVLVDTDHGPREIHALVSSGGSFGGNSLQQEIGLGQARAIREVRIVWPGGASATYPNLTMDRAYSIREGEPSSTPSPARPFRLHAGAASGERETKAKPEGPS
jgi:hypothetical protein